MATRPIARQTEDNQPSNEGIAMYDHHMTSLGAFFAIITMLLFWAAVVVGIIFLIKTLSQSRTGGAAPLVGGRPQPPHFEAERILAERFARGEIDEAEYRSRSAALRDRPGPTPPTSPTP